MMPRQSAFISKVFVSLLISHLLKGGTFFSATAAVNPAVLMRQELTRTEFTATRLPECDPTSILCLGSIPKFSPQNANQRSKNLVTTKSFSRTNYYCCLQQLFNIQRLCAITGLARRIRKLFA